MKLLFDENLSARLVELLAAEFPDSIHPELLGMRDARNGAFQIADEALEQSLLVIEKRA